MAQRDRGRPHLTLIPGGRARLVRLGELAVAAGPAGRTLFEVDGIVFEEDTFLVLSSEPIGLHPDQNGVRIISEDLEALPIKPGSVLLKGRAPVRLLAIIHDLDRRPPCREEWVRTALRNVLRLADQHRLHSLAMPVLGTVHGCLDAARALSLLREEVSSLSLKYLQRLWLLVSETERNEVLDLLEASSC